MIDGDRLRKALVAGMNSARMVPADVARAIGVSPSSLYNFLSGISHSLSWTTIVAISRLLGIRLHMLMGVEDPDVTSLVSAAMRTPAEPAVKDLLIHLAEVVVDQRLQLEVSGQGDLVVTTELDDGAPKPVFSIPEKERVILPWAATPRDLARRAFGVRVAGMAGAPFYPHGSILACIPPDNGPAMLEPGWRVLIRYREDGWPKTVWKTALREVNQGARAVDGMSLYLGRLGGVSEPRGVRRLGAPARIDVTAWRSQDKDVRLVGTVATAIIPEGPNL